LLNQDRRRWVRSRKLLKGVARWGKTSVNVVTTDVSGGGAFFSSRTLPAVGDDVSVDLHPHGPNSPVVEITGRVARVVTATEAVQRGLVPGFCLEWVRATCASGPEPLNDLLVRGLGLAGASAPAAPYGGRAIFHFQSGDFDVHPPVPDPAAAAVSRTGPVRPRTPDPSTTGPLPPPQPDRPRGQAGGLNLRPFGTADLPPGATTGRVPPGAIVAPDERPQAPTTNRAPPVPLVPPSERAPNFHTGRAAPVPVVPQSERPLAPQTGRVLPGQTVPPDERVGSPSTTPPPVFRPVSPGVATRAERDLYDVADDFLAAGVPPPPTRSQPVPPPPPTGMRPAIHTSDLINLPIGVAPGGTPTDVVEVHLPPITRGAPPVAEVPLPPPGPGTAPEHAPEYAQAPQFAQAPEAAAEQAKAELHYLPTMTLGGPVDLSAFESDEIPLAPLAPGSIEQTDPELLAAIAPSRPQAPSGVSLTFARTPDQARVDDPVTMPVPELPPRPVVPDGPMVLPPHPFQTRPIVEPFQRAGDDDDEMDVYRHLEPGRRYVTGEMRASPFPPNTDAGFDVMLGQVSSEIFSDSFVAGTPSRTWPPITGQSGYPVPQPSSPEPAGDTVALRDAYAQGDAKPLEPVVPPPSPRFASSAPVMAPAPPGGAPSSSKVRSGRRRSSSHAIRQIPHSKGLSASTFELADAPPGGGLHERLVDVDVPITYLHNEQYVGGKVVAVSSRNVRVETEAPPPGMQDPVMVCLPVASDGALRTVYLVGKLAGEPELHGRTTIFSLQIERVEEGRRKGVFDAFLDKVKSFVR